MTAAPHIGRKQLIGIGKEVTPGTAVVPARWLPKKDGGFAPDNTTIADEGAYGGIDGYRDLQTVKTIVKTDFSVDLRDVYFGDILNALYGQEYPCVRFPVTSVSGTPVVGETITESTSTATGTLRRADATYWYVDTTGGSGTFTGGKTLTGGTSSATATGGTIISPSTGRYHLFQLLNSNSHPTYTIGAHDDVGDSNSTYSMLDTLDLEITAGQYATAKMSWMGKKIGTPSAYTPSFTSQNPFLAKFASFKYATAFSGLDAASATPIKSAKLNFKKNVKDFQACGDTDVAAYYNTVFQLTGEFTLLYSATTFRDAVTASTKHAFRIAVSNTDASLGSDHPSFQFDIPVNAYRTWTRTSNNNDLVEQTVAFTATYDLSSAMTSQCLLANSLVTAY